MPRKALRKATRTMRDALIALQKEFVEQLKDEIYHDILSVPAKEKAYYEEYRRFFRKPFVRAKLEDVYRRAKRSHIVYMGDYHTLRYAQRAAWRIVRETARSGKPVILALEMIPAGFQHELDLFLEGGLETSDFLARIGYAENWGFNFDNYLPLFELAREFNFPIFALNYSAQRPKRSLLYRDFYAASEVALATAERPDATVFVLFGDLHLAHNHMPGMVERHLDLLGIRRRRLIIYQNSEQVYWELIKLGLEDKVEVVRFRPDCYCLMNVAPSVKFQSYLFWFETLKLDEPIEAKRYVHTELPAATAAESIAGSSVDFTDEIYELVRAVCSILGVDPAPMQDFEVYTAADAVFMSKLQRLSPPWRDAVLERLKASENAYVPVVGLVYLSNLSVNYAAEIAGRIVNDHLSQSAREAAGLAEPPEVPRGFYGYMLQAMLGYFASKVVNNKRKCYDDADFGTFLETRKHKRLPAKLDVERRAARLLPLHRRYEAEFAATGEIPPDCRSIYHKDPPAARRLSQALGYMLGEAVYRAMKRDRFKRSWLLKQYAMMLRDEDAMRRKAFKLLTMPDLKRKRR